MAVNRAPMFAQSWLRRLGEASHASFAPFFGDEKVLEGNNRLSVAHAGKIGADRPFFRAGLSDISAVFFVNLVNVFTEVFI